METWFGSGSDPDPRESREADWSILRDPIYDFTFQTANQVRPKPVSELKNDLSQRLGEVRFKTECLGTPPGSLESIAHKKSNIYKGLPYIYSPYNVLSSQLSFLK